MVKQQKKHEKHSTKITVQSQISSWVKPWNHPPDTYQYCKRFRVIQRITYVPSSIHGIWAMVIHPILGIITMGILNPIDGCMTIPLYEKTNHVLTTAHININKMISKKKHFQIISRTAFSPSEGTIFRTFQPRHKSWCSSPKSAATALCWNRSLSVASMTKMDKDEAPKKIMKVWGIFRIIVSYFHILLTMFRIESNILSLCYSNYFISSSIAKLRWTPSKKIGCLMSARVSWGWELRERLQESLENIEPLYKRLWHQPSEKSCYNHYNRKAGH